MLGLVPLCKTRSSRESGRSEKSETKQRHQEQPGLEGFNTEAVFRRGFGQGALLLRYLQTIEERSFVTKAVGSIHHEHHARELE